MLNEESKNILAEKKEILAEKKEILAKSERYSHFILLDEPKKFTELFAGKPYDCVQLHSAQIISCHDQKDVMGFFGAFSWDGENHDTYSEEMLVIGYDFFTNPDAGVNNGLEIIV